MWCAAAAAAAGAIPQQPQTWHAYIRRGPKAMWQQNNANNSNTQVQHAPRCWLEEQCATLAHTRSAVDGEAAVLGCSICLDL